jgi:hypothetical protein
VQGGGQNPKPKLYYQAQQGLPAGSKPLQDSCDRLHLIFLVIVIRRITQCEEKNYKDQTNHKAKNIFAPVGAATLSDATK